MCILIAHRTTDQFAESISKILMYAISEILSGAEIQKSSLPKIGSRILDKVDLNPTVFV